MVNPLGKVSSFLSRYSQTWSTACLALVTLAATAVPVQAQVFDPEFSANVNGPIHALAVQPDGKILIGGQFTLVNGVAKNDLARLNADGSLDTTFTTTGTDSLDVGAIAVLPDGRILVGGWFNSLAGVSRTNLARLLSDGTVDPAFTAYVQGQGNQGFVVNDILVEPGGTFLVAGNIFNANGIARTSIARLSTDGVLDGGFAPNVNWHIAQLTRDASGRILIAGNFTTVSGLARTGLARLNVNGTLDTTFAPTFTGQFPGASPVHTSAVRADGRILVGGPFHYANGVVRTHLAQLNADGTLDTSFDAPIMGDVGSGTVSAITMQPDGRILVGGLYYGINQIYSYFTTRLLPSGAYDFSFGSLMGTPSWFYSNASNVVLQADGKVLIAGSDFGTNIARLLADSPVPVNGDLRITGTALPEPVTPGNTLISTFTVTNVGTHPASRITLTDTLPAGLSYSSCSGSNGVTCGGTGNARTVTFPALATGESFSVSIHATVTAGAGATLVNTASVTSSSPDLVAANNSVTLTSHTPAPPTADLRLTMSATPSPVAPGGTLVYTLTLSNIGNLAASTVVVQDTLPADVTFVACNAPNGTCGVAGAARTVSYGSIGAGVTRTIVLTGTVASGALTFLNTATVSSATADADPSNNTASATTNTTNDVDGDGLDDTWERDFGLNPNSAAGDDGATGDPDHDARTNLQEFRFDGTHPRGFSTRFLAEGAINNFFDLRLALLNVGNANARVLYRFLQPGGTTLSRRATIGLNRRATISRADFAGLQSNDFSTVVESDQPLVLDRTMSWNGGVGSHAETGVPTPSTTWYLAEGSTSGEFALFYLVQNPNPTSTTLSVRYLLPAPQAPVVRSYPLAGLSRLTIPVDDQGGQLASTDVSAVLTAPVPIIVERAMYRSTPTQAFAAGHGSSGVTAPETSWFLAEGATGPFFDCFLLLANPGTQAANVTVDYLLSNGTTHSKTYAVAPESRFTIWLDNEQIPAGSGVRPLDNVAVSSTVTSSVPIIVERTMWWPGPAITSDFWTEAHNSPGATATSARWALAEGEVGGTENAETYILIANTSTSAGSASVTLYFEDGTTANRTFPLLPRSRRNVNVSADFPAAAGRRFGAIVQSLGSPAAQIVVERAMYTSPGGATWAAGTNALATPLP